MKLLAIDIGTAQIKGAVFEARFNRFELVNHSILPVEDGAEETNPLSGELSQRQIEALRSLWSLYSDKVDRVVVNIPNNLFTSRILKFPFADRKRILASARFQIEDEVPFDLEKCVLATQIFPTEDKKANVICGVAQTSQLRRFLEILQTQTGIDPDVITSPHAAFSAFFMRQSQSFQGKSTGIINLGHRKSSIVIFQNSMPILHRTSMVGGKQITEAIARSYNITLEEAEAAKRKSGFLAPPGVEQTEEQKVFSDLIAGVLEPVFHDFYQCLMAHFSRHHGRVDQIFVTGGTSQMPGVCDYLAARWQIAAFPLNITPTFETQTHKLNSNEELMLSESLALGLSQLEGRSKQALNFRLGSLKSSKTIFDSLNLRSLTKPIRLAAIVYVVAVLSLLIQNSILGPEVRKLEARRTDQIKRTLPNAKRSDIAKYRRDDEKLKRDVNTILETLRAKVGNLGAENNFTALNLLRAMSEAVPRTAITEVRKFELADDLLSLTLESPSERDLTGAIDAIKTVKWLSEKAPPVINRSAGNFTTTYSLSVARDQ